MPRSLRSALPLVALFAVACLNDAPSAPRSSSLSLRVTFQTATAGQAIRWIVGGVIPQQELVADTLLDRTVAAATGEQKLDAQVDLTPCLGLVPPDSLGPYCVLNIEVQLINADTVADDIGLGFYTARPGTVVQPAPVVLTAGANPPVITATDTARWVEWGLMRYGLTASDPDGDITYQYATGYVTGTAFTPDKTTYQTYYPPLRTMSAPQYAFETYLNGPESVVVQLYDSRFDASPVDTIPASYPVGSAFIDTLQVTKTADSVIARFYDLYGTSDSAELVLRNVDDSVRTDSLYFVCGGKFAPTTGAIRMACPLQVPFTQGVAILVPIDSTGNAGQGLRCTVGQAQCIGVLGRRVHYALRR